MIVPAYLGVIFLSAYFTSSMTCTNVGFVVPAAHRRILDVVAVAIGVAAQAVAATREKLMSLLTALTLGAVLRRRVIYNNRVVVLDAAQIRVGNHAQH